MKTHIGTDLATELLAPQTHVGGVAERRRFADRRRGDRRLDDALARQRVRRRHRTRELSLLAVLFFCILALGYGELDKRRTMASLPSRQVVQVHSDAVGMWEASPKLLAEYFANQDAFRRQDEGRVKDPRIREDTIRITRDLLMKKEEMLLARVKRMSWEEFTAIAESVKKTEEPPNPRDCHEALIGAILLTK